MKHLKTILLLFLVILVNGQSQRIDVCVEDSRTEYTYSVTSNEPNTVFYWFIDGVYQFGQTLTVDWATMEPGHHTITVYGMIGDCRSEKETYDIYIDECSTIYIPNAFTPDNDGTNDLWYPVGVGWEWIEVIVFDRWGGQVWWSNDLKGSWNGSFRNGLYYVQNDVYVYKVTWKGYNNDTEVIFGHVTVIR